MAQANPRWKITALLVIDMQKDVIDDNGLARLPAGKATLPNVIKAVEIAGQRGILVVVREHHPQGRDIELLRQHWYSAGKVGPVIKGSVDELTWTLANGKKLTWQHLNGEFKLMNSFDRQGRQLNLFLCSGKHSVLFWDCRLVEVLCTTGSRDAELADGLLFKEGDYKLVKTRFSAFFATHLHLFLQSSGIDRLVLTGAQTPNSIRQTAFDAVSLDYQSVTAIVDATAAPTPDIYAANIFDMKSVGIATPTLQEWSEADA